MISFRYHKIPDSNGTLKKPTIPVEFKMLSSGYIETIALVDSGADVTVLPKGIADLIGVKIIGESESQGIGGKVKVKTGSVTFRIKGEHAYHKITTHVEIIEDDSIPVLLGRRGLFDRFKVIIDEQNQKVSLKKHPQRIIKK